MKTQTFLVLLVCAGVVAVMVIGAIQRFAERLPPLLLDALASGRTTERLICEQFGGRLVRGVVRRVLVELEVEGRVTLDRSAPDNVFVELSRRESLKRRLIAAVNRVGQSNWDDSTADTLVAEARFNRDFYRLLCEVADEFDPDWRERGVCFFLDVPVLATLRASTWVDDGRGDNNFSSLMAGVVIRPPEEQKANA